MQQSWSNDGTFPPINIRKASVSFNASSFAEPSFASASSNTSDKKRSLASERWNVQKLQNELDDKMMSFYSSQVAKCRKTEDMMNQRAERLYNAIFQEVKWSNPPIPHVHINLVLEYCRHLIASGSSIPFPKEMDLRTWNAKVKGTQLEKIIVKVKEMYMKLFRTIAKRDTDMINLQNNLLSTSESLKVKNDGTLRWLMEKNYGKKDEYFTLWHLARTNRLRVLQVLLSSATKMKDYGEEGINATDPDFGMTALHYACRESHADIIHYLLGENADVNIIAPDGRTALHFAAAYSTREICLALLGAGVDSQLRDHFHNTPLDLALQNNNKKTIATLQHWEELMVGFPDKQDDDQQLLLLNQQPSTLSINLQLPRPGEFAFDRNEDVIVEKEVMPAEYAHVSAEIFQHMSRDLQFLAQRLNGYNPYLLATTSFSAANITSDLRSSSSFVLNSSTYGGASEVAATAVTESIPFASVNGDGKKHILAEIRLCTKCFASCVQENLLDEALRALKRRWLAAKRLYGLITEEKQAEQSLIHANNVNVRYEYSKENSDTISELPFDDDRQLLDNDENQESIQVVNQEEEAPTDILRPLEEHNMKHFELDKIANDFLSTFTTITYLPPTPAVATTQQASVSEEPFPPVTHVSEKIFVEDESFLLLTEEKQKKKDAAAIIQQILDRYAIQEHVTRLQEYSWRYENIEQLDHYTQYSSTASLADSSMTLTSTELSVYRYKPTYSLENNVENYAMSLAQELVEVLLVRKKYDQALLVLEDSLRLKDGVLITARLRCLFQLCDLVIYVVDRWEKQQHKFARIYNRWRDVLAMPPLSSYKEAMVGIFSMNQTSFTLDELGSISLPLLEAPSTAVLLPFLSDSAMKLKTIYVDLLERCIDAAQEAIDLASVMSARQLMEPLSIAQAMGFLGQARERLGRYIEAYKAMEEGSLLATRVPYGSQMAIELMLEALRLYVKYFLKTEEQCQMVARKSAEINRMIEAYAPGQFTVNAELWLRKSVELLAIATNTIRDPFVQIENLSVDVKVSKRDERQIRKALKKKIKYLE